MSTRRDFLKLAAIWGPAAAVIGLHRPERYTPVGHIDADDPAARYIERITLDGREVENVHELDDVEGWLRRYIYGDDFMRLERLSGTVRVYWTQPA